jgi:hypothetical protein
VTDFPQLRDRFDAGEDPDATASLGQERHPAAFGRLARAALVADAAPASGDLALEKESLSKVAGQRSARVIPFDSATSQKGENSAH